MYYVPVAPGALCSIGRQRVNTRSRIATPPFETPTGPKTHVSTSYLIRPPLTVLYSALSFDPNHTPPQSSSQATKIEGTVSSTLAAVHGGQMSRSMSVESIPRSLRASCALTVNDTSYPQQASQCTLQHLHLHQILLYRHTPSDSCDPAHSLSQALSTWGSHSCHVPSF